MLVDSPELIHHHGEAHGMNDRTDGISCQYSDITDKETDHISFNTQ